MIASGLRTKSPIDAANLQFVSYNLRPVAIIKIWNPEIENKKLPKLFFWNYLWKLFRKPKLHFQKKNLFSWNRVVIKCC